MPRSTKYAATAAVAVLLFSEPAFAALGSGGNGLLDQVIQWFVTNIVSGLIAAAVLFVGGLLIFGRHTLAGIAVVIIGALVISNYQAIAGFF